jgi:hypothetical protein
MFELRIVEPLPPGCFLTRPAFALGTALRLFLVLHGLKISIFLVDKLKFGQFLHKPGLDAINHLDFFEDTREFGSARAEERGLQAAVAEILR